MRVAIISDIHANVYALESVLADIGMRGVDTTVNLGDTLYGPISPKETLHLLQKHDIITISGNQDRQIHEATEQEISLNPTMQYVNDELDNDAISWLRSLPFDSQLSDDIYLCHGSPTNDLTYLLENVESGHPVVRANDEIESLLDNQTSKVILCGHTHIPRTVQLNSGQLIVNPGSVGLPAYSDDEPIKHSMENFSYHASYAIVEKRKNRWTVEHIKVDYDYQGAVKKVLELDRHDWSHFLSTGRGLEF